MEKNKYMEGQPLNTNNKEKRREPFLQELWIEYGFPGRPPFADSIAEKRLKETCDKYAICLEHNRDSLPGSEAEIHGKNKIPSSESARRELHNQIAIMTVGRQRSGMNAALAKTIADFAYEYSRGFTFEDKEKYKD